MCCIYGEAGNGKTHLLHATSRELYKRGKFARVYVFPELLAYLRSAINSDKLNYDDLLFRYCFAERLIIDDVGAADTLKPGRDGELGFGERVFEQIIVSRYERDLMTLISTNVDIESLTQRVKSRLKDREKCYLVLNKAEDYRPKKNGH